MFTKKELETKIDEALQLPRCLLAVTRFSYLDFREPSGEEEIQIHRGLKREYEGPIHFWATCLQSLEQGESSFLGFRPGSLGPVALSALCRPVDEAELASLTREKLYFLAQPWSLDLGGKVTDAMVMDQSTDELSVLWETDTFYGAFFWDTTA